MLSTDMMGRLNIFGHNHNISCMDGAQVGIFQEAGQVILHYFLQCHDHTHTWKCRSYLPQSWAISHSNLTKGHLKMRSSVLLWYFQISWRATIPGHYCCGIFIRHFWVNSLWGADSQLTPTLQFLKVLPPLPSGLVSTLEMTLATFPPLLVSLPPLIFSTIYLVKGGNHCMCPQVRLPILPCSQCHLCSSHAGMEKQPIRDCDGLLKVTDNPYTRLHIFLENGREVGLYFTHFRERRQVFQGAMRAQVGTTFSNINSSGVMEFLKNIHWYWYYHPVYSKKIRQNSIPCLPLSIINLYKD